MFNPPYPSFSARFDPAVTKVVMACFGVQYRSPRPAAVAASLDELTAAMATSDGPTSRSGWRSLEDLETWSESHPSHVAIFRAALKYLSTMGPAAMLRLHHEVTVAEASQQQFTYLGCHDRTGLLRTQ